MSEQYCNNKVTLNNSTHFCMIHNVQKSKCLNSIVTTKLLLGPLGEAHGQQCNKIQLLYEYIFDGKVGWRMYCFFNKAHHSHLL